MDRSEQNEYYEWLTDIVGGERKHSLLLHILFQKEFYWTVPFDEDRAADGIDLRHTYLKFIERQVNLGLKACSVLEMLVALSCSCEDNIMHDRDLGDRTPEWFWMMLHNLGLDVYSNDHFSYEAEYEIHHILDNWLERKFGENGKGSPFPCYRFDNSAPMWIQLNSYLMENYNF